MPNKRERRTGSPKEIASLCGLSLLTVYKHARAGSVAAEKAPGKGWTVAAQRSKLSGGWNLVPVRRLH